MTFSHGENSSTPGDSRFTFRARVNLNFLWVTLPPYRPHDRRLLTQVHVARPGVTLLVTFATPQLHELYV